MFGKLAQKFRVSQDSLVKVLLIVIIIEACIGGGGRLLNIGTISLRMYLFALGLCFAIYYITQNFKSINRTFLKSTLAFVLLTVTSFYIAYSSKISMHAAFNEIKPKLYFLSLLFFSIAIRSIDTIKLIREIISKSALVLSLIYIFTIVVWKLGISDYSQLLNLLNPDHDPGREYIFRNDITFYFKALIYVAVAIFFSLYDENKIRKLIFITIFLLAIALTLTRGVWLAACITLIFYVIELNKSRMEKLGYSILLILIGVSYVIAVSKYLPAAEISSRDRVDDIILTTNTFSTTNAFTKNYAYLKLLFGKGPGFKTPSPIEITYLDIFLKSGLLGILFWLFPIFYIFNQMKKINPSFRNLALPFYLSSLFVYIVSMTNTFLTNPIGMAIVLISMVCVTRIAEFRFTGQVEPRQD